MAIGNLGEIMNESEILELEELLTNDECEERLFTLAPQLIASAKRELLLDAAIRKHHGQKADDRCHFDDDELYASAGLPPCDKRVGDKAAMMVNCARFLERRCEGGGWPSYADLEKQRDKLLNGLKNIVETFKNSEHVDGDPRYVMYVALAHQMKDIAQNAMANA